MLCMWCDEIIVTEIGEHRIVWDNRDMMWFHDYCFEDGTRGMDIQEDENGNMYIVLPFIQGGPCRVCGGVGMHSSNCTELDL